MAYLFVRDGVVIASETVVTPPNTYPNTDMFEWPTQLINCPDPRLALTDAQNKAFYIDKLWKKADSLAYYAFDHSSRVRAVAWLIDPACPQWRKDRIAAIQTWMDTIWGAYYAAKFAIASGDFTADIDIDTIGPCPYEFANLISE